MQKTYSEKKVKSRTSLLKILNKEYLGILDISESSNNLLQKVRNDLKKLDIQTNKLISNHLSELKTSKNLKGDKLLIGCDNLMQLRSLCEYFNKESLVTRKFLKVDQIIPEDYIIDKGPTKLKAGPAFQIMEAVTSVKIQKNIIVLENPIAFNKGERLTEDYFKVLKLLELPLKIKTLKLEKILSTKTLKYIPEKTFMFLNNPHSLDQDLTKIIKKVSQVVTPSGPLVLDDRIKNIVYLLKNT